MSKFSLKNDYLPLFSIMAVNDKNLLMYNVQNHQYMSELELVVYC